MYDFGLLFAFVVPRHRGPREKSVSDKVWRLADVEHAISWGGFMLLTREQIENIAHLARLALTAAELPVYQQSLSAIFDFVGELDRADTANVEPMAHPLPGLSQRL